jgi:hypothetical protein
MFACLEKIQCCFAPRTVCKRRVLQRKKRSEVLVIPLSVSSGTDDRPNPHLETANNMTLDSG